MNSHRKAEVFLTSATDGGKWQASRSNRFTQGMTSKVDTGEEQVWTKQKQIPWP
jgi:hypothetical protein